MSTNRKHILRARDYLAEESGTIIKSSAGSPSIALVYPNTYFLGMSNLGFQTLYALFNHDAQTVCERVFLPDDVVLGTHTQNEPLRTLESGRDVNSMNCVAFSISFETDYLYFLNVLDLANIPFDPQDRRESDPIIIAGGAAITINPEPIRPFCDALFVGEAEEAAQEIIAALRDHPTRSAKIAALGKIEGMYLGHEIQNLGMPSVPNLMCAASETPNSLEKRVSLAHLRQYKRRVPQDINGFPIESQIHTPYSEFGKLSLIEVQRGCGRGCKFCAEGFIYTPFRQRDFNLIKKQVDRGLKYRNKIGLIGADLLVYPEIVELFDYIHAQGGTFSPSSVRVDALSDDIIARLVKSEHRTLAIAPEAGSDALRSGVNKKFNNEQIVGVIDRLINAGIPNIKMYFMIGLPGETEQDILHMIDLVDEARKVLLINAKKHHKIGSLIMSINPFVPKPRTPYQVGVYAGTKAIDEKVSLIKRKLLPKGNIRVYHENPFYAYVQALLSNGTTHMADYLKEVFVQKGSLRKALKPFLDKNRVSREVGT